MSPSTHLENPDPGSRETGLSPSIEIDHVTKAFGDSIALRTVDLEIARARTTVLIGPSGCGKSTLLRLIVGLIQPTAGAIRFEGEEVSPVSVAALRQRMGYVIQEGGLFPHLSAKDNILLMAKQLGWSSARQQERLDTLLSLTKLPREALGRYPNELSGGQRQRVSLMRALMLDPDVLLLDEPLGALDPMIRADLQQELRAIFRRLDKTVVLVTHDLHEAGYFADDIVVFREGEIEQRGRFADLLRKPATDFVRAFVSAQRGLTADEGARS
ncbi:MAG: ABC transporter ATP-binding protein [Myxococcota bacterium]